MGKHTDRINYTRLLIAMVVLLLATSSGLESFVFAYQDDAYSHRHATSLTDPNLVCGDHLCNPYQGHQHYK